jgi:hypothetical protein
MLKERRTSNGALYIVLRELPNLYGGDVGRSRKLKSIRHLSYSPQRLVKSAVAESGHLRQKEMSQ